MKSFFYYTPLLILFLGCMKPGEHTDEISGTDDIDTTTYNEKHRLQFHFSPPAHWMNDPNGMVFYKGRYHLFYQYYPDSAVWGPMHWGHAVSQNMIHWKNLPIALYPDSLGYIFSGSAIVDWENISGFGSTEKPPLVALYTYHNMEKERAGETEYQTQGLAYSLDDGQTWEKYEGNPVINNPGIKDFRDPKLRWHEETGQWILTLAVMDHIAFYSSTDLKKWTHQSDFGTNKGAHGGVWECPDLFPVATPDGKETKWVLLVSINPGAPQGGSGTQYFIGKVDGKKFTPDEGSYGCLDYGPDNYAGVTWSDITDGRTLFLSWISSWLYAQNVPTTKWRGAMTVPRNLTLFEKEGRHFLASVPVLNWIHLSLS